MFFPDRPDVMMQALPEEKIVSRTKGEGRSGDNALGAKNAIFFWQNEGA